MEIYLSNLVACSQQSVDEQGLLLDAIKPFAGQVGIEFFIHTYSPEYMNDMERIPEWIGAYPTSVHAPFVGVEATSSPGTQEYEHLMDAYAQAWRMAASLHCDHMVIHYHERHIDPEEKAGLKAAFLQNLQELLAQAKAHNITLLLENLALPSKGTPLFTEDEFISLANQTTEARVLIDLGHLGVAGWDMERVISSLAPRICGYHLHNNDGKQDLHDRIRKGTIDIERFFSLYKKLTPKADIILEYVDNDGVTASELTDDLRYVMKMSR